MMDHNLEARWLAGDEEGAHALADGMTAQELRKFGVDALLACCAAVGRAPAAVLRVAEVGQTDPGLGHAAFDGVRTLTLAEHAKARPPSPASGLLEVAEAAARVIYNSTNPEDPFDADSEVYLFAATSGLCRSLPLDRRELLSEQLSRALTSARLSASTRELAAIRREKLAARWFVGDPETCRALEEEMTAAQLRSFAVDALSACCGGVSGVPSAVLQVLEAGRSAPGSARIGFNAVRELRLAAEVSLPMTLHARLLRVAESAARVIYNATNPDDSFDRASGEWLFEITAALYCALPNDLQLQLGQQLRQALVTAKSTAVPAQPND